ncbi:unnamed protein product [Nezara viridula]|uniref:Spermatogenesis-associated protein 6 N-terminal domain-containing protein n=1 Tax=Nezara viridula TaxID=85310 RepID=A0A9P0EI63_NEZVI|nr:unnamed protein product [Nezara viridula]
MQRKKVFNVSLFLDLHAVTCPGVWLCPKGKVAVRVAIFGVSESTKKLTPSFPLFFHERFHFQKKYKKVSSLHQVERVLHRAPVLLELLQYPQGTTECVKLAEFRAAVGDIIFPPGGDMDLLFSTTDTFPGIIGPKGEVTTQLTLTESGIKDNAVPTTVLSKGTKGKQIEEPLIRQKPVCHTKHYLYCGCFDKNAPQRMLAKVMKRQKDLLVKKRTRQEAIKQTPAHIMSHKNHGDFLPGYDEQSNDFDSGEVKFGRCSCCQEQAAFGPTSNRSPSRISEVSSKGKNMKDGFIPQTMPQSRRTSSMDYQYNNFVPEEEENNPSETVPLLPHKEDGSCCLCCPRAPGYVFNIYYSKNIS